MTLFEEWWNEHYGEAFNQQSGILLEAFKEVAKKAFDYGYECGYNAEL